MKTEDLFMAAKAESMRAKVLFPHADHLTLALAEEAGEVTKAVLNLHSAKGTIKDVDKEIVQCMAMCIRLWNEGDPTVGLPSVRDEIKKHVGGQCHNNSCGNYNSSDPDGYNCELFFPPCEEECEDFKR